MAGTEYYATIRGETRRGTLQWLSECFCEIRDESGEGCSTFGRVDVFVAGTTQAIGHISYNGRVWDRPTRSGLATQPYSDDSKLLYDNRTQDTLEAMPDAIKAALERDYLSLRCALHSAYGPRVTADILSKIAYARNCQPETAPATPVRVRGFSGHVSA